MADAIVNAEKGSSPANQGEFEWVFHKNGGVYQVELRRGEDIRRLGGLDPKLWIALSCPAQGLEFNAKTLTLIDTDNDGRIRIPEVVEAANWICARLKNPDSMIDPPEAFPLAFIDDSTDDGRRLAATGRAVLAGQGKTGAEALALDDVALASARAAAQMFNGDGVLPPLPSLDADVRLFIQTGLEVIGGVADASGLPGVNADIARALIGTLEGVRAWRKNVDTTAAPLGKDTAEAWDAIRELREKIDDYFIRCELAAYAPAARDLLNAGDKLVIPADNGLLDDEALAALPLSRIDADKPLDLVSGINPVWRARVERLAELAKPLLTDPEKMTRDDWKRLTDAFSPYALALAEKPEAVKADGIAYPPIKSADRLDEELLRAILDSGVADKFAALVAEDSAMPGAAADIAAIEKLVLFHRHLHRLLVNFVSFDDFYSLERSAMFQSGTLYIDGRACRLCMPADKVDEHSSLAGRSQLFLLYCKCGRGAKPGTREPAETRNIVAAVTAGDSDLLLEGRNGVFVDNEGKDWDASVVKIVSNPIGLWQAVWNPYKKFGNMVTEAIAKFASARQAGLMESAGKKLDQAGAAAASGTPPPAFDIGKNIGIFAAVGIALGAIGTALGSMANAFFSMHWWQFPLLFIGLFVIISGPSLLMAWLKLRQRTLGPLLEASGWAVNGKAAINYALSNKLTRTAELPENVKLDYIDELTRYKRKRTRMFWRAVLVGIALVLSLIWLYRSITGPPPAPERKKPAAAEPAPAHPAPAPAPAAG